MGNSITSQSSQMGFTQLVAFFLAEIIRSRRTSLRRAAEISKRVVENVAFFTSEETTLKWVTDIEHEFEEMTSLKEALHFNYESSDISVYEREIREYASGLFECDMAKSASFLKDAAHRHATIQELCIKYPEFCQYVLNKTDKGQLLQQFQPVSA